MLNKDLLEQQLQELPLFQYAFMKTEELTFTERSLLTARWSSSAESIIMALSLLKVPVL